MVHRGYTCAFYAAVILTAWATYRSFLPTSKEEPFPALRPARERPLRGAAVSMKPHKIEWEKLAEEIERRGGPAILPPISLSRKSSPLPSASPVVHNHDLQPLEIPSDKSSGFSKHGGEFLTTEATCASVAADLKDARCRNLVNPRDAFLIVFTDGDRTSGLGDGNYLDRLTRILAKHFKGKPRQLMLDIGANLGYFTVSAGAMGHSVIAFEPGAINTDRLVRSIQVNSLQDSVTVYQAAVAARTTPLHIFLNPELPDVKSNGLVVAKLDDPLLDAYKEGSEWYTEIIPAITLDGLHHLGRLTDRWQRKVGVVKIDVEGFESMVVSGGKHFFEDVKPRLIFMEINPSLWMSTRASIPGWMSIIEVLEFFKHLGYIMYEEHAFLKHDVYSDKLKLGEVAKLLRDSPMNIVMVY